MTIAERHDATDIQSEDLSGHQADDGARIRFRQPVGTSGFIDAAWWPRTRNLTEELPLLMDVLWAAARNVNRITYHLGTWEPAPRRMQIRGRTVRLGGFATSDPGTVRLSDPWGRERIDVLVIAPETDPAVAERVFAIASHTDNPYTAAEILARASAPSDAAGGPS
jgi:hypothetical protein